MAKLSPEQLEQYNEQGWIVPDYRVPASLLSDAQARATAMMAERPEYRDLYPDMLGADIRFMELAREEGLLEILEQIVGPDIVLWTAGMFGKPAHNGKATPWHQDGEYWPIRPLETATVWIALDGSTVENGCMRVISGSHRKRRLFAHHEVQTNDVTLHQEIDSAAFDAGEIRDIELEPGQISIHDAFLVHGSRANQSTKRRAGVTYRYMPARCHFDRKLAAQQAAENNIPNISKRPIYLVKGSGDNTPNRFSPLPDGNPPRL